MGRTVPGLAPGLPAPSPPLLASVRILSNYADVFLLGLVYRW
jgi:hypothetical protein